MKRIARNGSVGWSILFVVWGLSSFCVQAAKPKRVSLSAAEQAWLEPRAQTLPLWYDFHFPPVEFQSAQKEYVGMSREVISLIESRLGVEFAERGVEDWTAVLDGLRDGSCAITAGIARTPERETYAFFSKPYLEIPIVIIGTDKLGDGISLENLAGLRVAVGAGYATEYHLENSALQLELIPMNSVEDGLRAVAFGQVDAYVENLAVASYYIIQNGISNLKVAGVTDYLYDLRISVSRHYPELFRVVEKAIDQIDPAELRAVRNRWVTLRPEERDYSKQMQRLKGAIAFFALLFGGVATVSFFLKRKLAQRLVELNRAQEDVVLSEARFRSFFQHAPIALVELDLKGAVVAVNDAALRNVGYAVEDVPTLDDWWQLSDPDSSGVGRESWSRRLAAAIESGRGKLEAREYSIRRKDGEVRTFLVGANVLENRVLLFLLDIHTRKRMENELRQEKEHLKVTLESIGDAVIVTDTQGRIARMNSAAVELTGWSQDDALGMPLDDLFVILDHQTRNAVASPVSKALDLGEVVGLDSPAILIKRDQTECLVADSAAPIRTHVDDIIGAVLVFRDVTEEYALQEQLRHSAKMDAIGQLAGGVAHDFNNVLGGIVGATEIAERQLPDDSTVRPYLKIVLDSAERASGLTGKLLAFARKQPVAFERLDAHLSIQNTQAILQNTLDRRIHLELDLAAAHACVLGDPSLLQSACLNLCINASHAMPEGGTLSIRTRNLELDEAYCHSSTFKIKPGPYLQIEICDTGCGIPAHDLPRIFEPFFTTKGRGHGTGLGLAAVFGTVQQHHGALAVYSEVDWGTSFHILLPQAEEGAECVEASPMEAISGSGRILVVDDERSLRETAQAMLENLGYEVQLAENGRECVELFERDPSAIDLVLLDMIMPEMNGRDCFSALKKIAPAVRVILVSGFARESDVQQMTAQGLAGVLLKPYRRVDLSRAIDAALKRA